MFFCIGLNYPSLDNQTVQMLLAILSVPSKKRSTCGNIPYYTIMTPVLFPDCQKDQNFSAIDEQVEL